MSRKFNKSGRRVTKSRRYVVTQWYNLKKSGFNLVRLRLYLMVELRRIESWLGED